ncbi:TRAP-type mannitol/chloroaromatic compound transport system substrate-binding protein [Natronocella acetinitrilica]|uniref:TRAP-type mannitol/chloroaromatic compound transport system substrate-binding protein n=1 Tax=Natronocella acetinitrilica TaxID=414046 RepID=A0AAE3G9U6_9GAMM|nr:TRAP transporter substrate-binding protein DctP [Natronocella acetinitrilica]MCP1677173.1 TRAP-type mannitol/chloroaromatic compound transport system substrate-binding protein [Natronocella acetinitrilica]
MVEERKVSGAKTVSRRDFLKKSAAATAGAAAAIGAPAVISSTNSKFKWTIQSHWTPGVWYFETVYREFARRVEEATAGEIEIDTRTANSVVSTQDILGAVRRGRLDASFIFPGYWVGELPVAGHLNGNLGTFASHEEMHLFMYEMGALDVIREAYAERGVYQAGPMSFGGITVFAREPLVTLDDFRGFNIRSTGTPARVFERLGASPTMVHGNELYQAMQTGIVDGAHWGCVSTGWGMNLQEVSSYIMQPDMLSHSNGEFIVNMDRWNELGSDHKRVIHECVRAMSADASAHFRHRDFLLMEEFVQDFGGEIVQMDPSVMEAIQRESMVVVDEISEQDPRYSGRVGEILHEFMRLTGKV